MKEPQNFELCESVFRSGATTAVTSNVVRHSCGATLVLTLGLLMSALALMGAQTGTSRTAGIREHLQKAAEYLKANDPNSAVKEFNAVLTLDPKNADAYANLGVIAFFQHDYQATSQYLRKALAIDPSLTKTQALLGICERRLGQPSAQALLEKSFSNLKDKNLRIQVGLELANIYYQQGNLDRTASVMRSLVDLDPDNVEILYMAQLVYTELADDTLNKLAIIAPGSARMQQVIAEHLINEGDLKGAIEHYKKALEIAPRLPGVRYELAQAIIESGKGDSASRDEAQKQLETAIALEGDSAKVQCELGTVALLRSDIEGASFHFTRALTLDPLNTQAQLGLGRVLLLTDKPQEAVKYLEMAVHSDPLNEEAHYRIAEAYRRLQMMDKAKKEVQLFQEIKKSKDQVAELYRQMNKQTKPQANETPDNDQ